LYAENDLCEYQTLKKMKKKFLIFAATGVIAMMSLTAMAQAKEDKDAAKARKDVTNAKKDLKEAKIDSAADFQKFKLDAEAKIRENEKKIAQLKAKKVNESQEVKDDYDKKVAALERRNTELRERINQANPKTSGWTSFKRKFNQDMESLERSIRDI
jgi:hypothetical protein